MARSIYPLEWPKNFVRSKSFEIKESKFKKTSIILAAKDIMKQAKKMHFANVIISSNMPTRRDGLPYSTGREPNDRAVAVWWRSSLVDGTEQVMACDRWRTVGENMRALALSMQAMANLDRYGATQVVKRAFAGFAELPPGNYVQPWREVFGVHEGSPEEMLEAVRKSYQRLITKYHPDKPGGSHERTVDLNRAWDDCVGELIK